SLITSSNISSTVTKNNITSSSNTVDIGEATTVLDSVSSTAVGGSTPISLILSSTSSSFSTITSSEGRVIPTTAQDVQLTPPINTTPISPSNLQTSTASSSAVSLCIDCREKALFVKPI